MDARLKKSEANAGKRTLSSEPTIVIKAALSETR